MLLTLQFGKHRIGDRDTGVVPVDAGELDELFGMRQRQRPEHKSVEDGKDCNGGPNTNGKNNDYDRSEAGSPRERPKSITRILTQRSH
jgi:hypothetical protein